MWQKDTWTGLNQVKKCICENKNHYGIRIQGNRCWCLFPFIWWKDGDDVGMTNEELVEQIQAGINVRSNLEILYEQNKPFIYSVIKPFMKYAEPDDLFQEAYLGLHDAVYAYEPGDSKFITYLPWKIRKHCIHFPIQSGFHTVGWMKSENIRNSVRNMQMHMVQNLMTKP